MKIFLGSPPNELEAEVEATKGTHTIRFTAVAQLKLVRILANEAQNAMGYNAAGYGAASSIEHAELDDHTWRTTWFCYASCD